MLPVVETNTCAVQCFPADCVRRVRMVGTAAAVKEQPTTPWTMQRPEDKNVGWKDVRQNFNCKTLRTTTKDIDFNQQQLTCGVAPYTPRNIDSITKQHLRNIIIDSHHS